jgi:hypothetical protein
MGASLFDVRIPTDRSTEGKSSVEPTRVSSATSSHRTPPLERARHDPHSPLHRRPLLHRASQSIVCVHALVVVVLVAARAGMDGGAHRLTPSCLSRDARSVANAVGEYSACARLGADERPAPSYRFVDDRPRDHCRSSLSLRREVIILMLGHIITTSAEAYRVLLLPDHRRSPRGTSTRQQRNGGCYNRCVCVLNQSSSLPGT